MTMINDLASATEAELGALFVNCRRGAETRMDLTDMVHAQPPTPTVMYRSTEDVFVNDNIRQQCSIEINMRLYWVRDRVKQRQCMVYWMSGEHNLAD